MRRPPARRVHPAALLSVAESKKKNGSVSVTGKVPIRQTVLEVPVLNVRADRVMGALVLCGYPLPEPGISGKPAQ
jgi:hypothetical protein